MTFITSPKKFRCSLVPRQKVFLLAQILTFAVMAASANVSNALSVSSVVPATGPVAGGNVVQIVGSGFTPNAQVWVGGSLAPVTKFAGPTSMYVRVAAHQQSAVEVDVFQGGAVYRLNGGYTYLNSASSGGSSGGGTSDSVSAVSPNSLTAAAITVTGSGVPSGAKIQVNGTTLATTFTSSSLLRATAPALAAGSYAVGVLNPDGSKASSSIQLTYTTPSTTATGTPLSACGPITKSGTYYLANDVTCTNMGFALNADNITFNLNGHTIRYGSTSEVVPAISICDTWYPSLPSSSCGNGHHAKAVIYNGKIVQTKGTTPFTHAIWIGQANGITPGSISSLNITIQEPGTQAIWGNFAGPGWVIQNNTFNDNVTQIQQPGQGVLSARSQFQGMVLTMYDGNNIPGSGDIIAGNTFNGTPQGAIYDTNQNTQIYSNVITLSSMFSNDYGVVILADGQQVHNNTIQGRGRGIDAESSNWNVYNNTINVHEEANNSEYGGCELEGSDGIRIKNYGVDSTGFKLTGNNVTVNAAYCQANAMRLTQLTSGASGTISGNTFKTVAGSGPDYALSLDQDQSSVTFSNNSFTGTTCAEIAWDGANQTVQAGQKWSCPSQALYDGDGALGGGALTSPNLTIQDSFAGTPKVYCGNYAGSRNQIGSYVKQCN
jgi:hypothetical protein